jgi:hypothetical protein
MDILTPKGQKTVEQEKVAIRIFLKKYPDFSYVETPKDQPADIDGFIVKNTTMVSGVEVKCRMMSYHDIMNKFDGKWLITYDKIERGISICRSLGIDFRGFLYLVPDQILLIVRLWDCKTGEAAIMDVEETRTQATVNGGSIVRLNAYVDVKHAAIITI